jgi:DNA-binding beta-propeller fold protein YncE
MRLLNLSCLAACIVLLPNVNSQAQNQTQSGYHVAQKVLLGGDGGWDFITFDDQGHRLFISRSTHVMVVDADSGKVVGDIPNTSGVHGIALVPEVGKGFTSDGRDSSVTIFDLQSLKMLGQVRVGQNPDDIFYDVASKHIFTLNGGSHDATEIDPQADSVIGTIHFEGRPEFAVADGQGHIYLDLEDKSEIVALDSHSLNILSTWPLAPGEEPTGMALDKSHHRLFVGCPNNIMIIMNADNGKVITSMPIGSGVDAVAYDSELDLVFSSNGDGTLTVIKADSADKYSVLENVPTQKGARTMALDLKSHRIYLVTADFGPAPAPTADRPHPRPSILPNSFVLLIVGKQ